jgi:predicted metal-dependent HD superfamily phosphohydrolase
MVGCIIQLIGNKMKISPTAEPAKAKWTKMPKYAAGGDAMMVMCDNDLPYHNWNHLVAMYNYLADTKQPYNVELDYAIMFHDYIYDASPKKEFRSAVAFEKIALDVDEPLYPACNVNIVKKLIMATEEHVFSKGDDPRISAIIRADLSGLTDTLATVQNFASLLEEATMLYNVSYTDYYLAVNEFMKGLSARVDISKANDDPRHQEFYDEVQKGIALTRRLAYSLVD